MRPITASEHKIWHTKPLSSRETHATLTKETYKLSPYHTLTVILEYQTPTNLRIVGAFQTITDKTTKQITIQ